MIIDKFKGGIGTSSRKHGEYTVGVLIQSNYGRRNQLAMAGVHIGEMLNELLPLCGQRTDNSEEQGSIIPSTERRAI
jgi:D-aminopeptidase